MIQSGLLLRLHPSDIYPFSVSTLNEFPEMIFKKRVGVGWRRGGNIGSLCHGWDGEVVGAARFLLFPN